MFLNPFMLFGLTAVSVPIIIHLLNRRQYDRMVWAAMRFLRISVEKNQRRMKIEDMLLLALRCLLLALLALALARPVVRAVAALAGQGSSVAVIVLDNSYSMSQSDGVQSRFDAGKKAADEVMKSLPVGSKVALLLASDGVTPLIANPTLDLQLARRQLQEAPLYDRGTDLLPAVKGALETLRGQPATRKEIYLITDGQAAGWRQMGEIRRLFDENKRDVRFHMLFVGSSEQRNLGVTALRLEGGLCPVNVPVRLEVAVRNFGKLEVRDINVSIAVDSDPSMDQATLPAIPPGEQRSVSLFARLKNEGYHTIAAKIDPDHLPADDTRAIAVRVVKQVKVLLIDGDTGREPRESEVFFLKAALRPVPRAEWDDYYVKLTTKTPTELDGVRFEDFDAVISANVTDFGQLALASLANYVKTGGALWIFPGDNINPQFYNDQLYQKLGLLPAALGSTRGDAENQEKYFALQDKNYEHEIVSLWRDPGAGTLTAARFFKVYELLESGSGFRVPGPGENANRNPEPGTRNPTLSRVIIRFQDNKPAMMERNVGQGRVILFASTADTAWNDLGARAGIWVPLVNRTLGYLVARQDEHLTLAVGQPFVFAAPIEWVGKDALITKAGRGYGGSKVDEVKESRRIEMVNGVPTLSFGPTDFAGAYDVKVGDAGQVRFAAQANTEESNLDMLSDEQFKLLGAAGQVVKWQPGTALRDELEQGRIGTELWFPLAVIALMLAAAETVLAHWFSKPK